MTDKIALHVVATWEDHVMGMELVVPGKGPYVVGGTGHCTFPMDEEALGGRDRWALIDENGTIHVPDTARDVRRSNPGGFRRETARKVHLGMDETLSLTLGSVHFEIQAHPAPVRPRLPVEINLGALAWAVSGVALFATTLALLWYAPRPPCEGAGICGFDPVGKLLGKALPADEPTLTPMGWVGQPTRRPADPCTPPASESTSIPRTDAPLTSMVGYNIGPNFGFGTIPITGSTTGGAGTGVPEDVLWVSETELQGLFGYPMCIQQPR